MRARLRMTFVMAATLTAPAALAAEPVRHTVISAKENLSRGDFSLSSRDVPGAAKFDWSVKSHILHGGKSEGVQLLRVDNGAMVITLIPTRGLSILSVKAGDLKLGWDSPVKDVVHPQFVDLDTRGGLGWLEGFNEFLVRCGFEFAGHPGKDEFIDNTGAKAEMNLTLHGKAGNIPASEVEVLVDREAPHTIRVRGVVHERGFYGPKLELVTELSTVPGSHEFRLTDVLTNRGAASQEFQLIYHVNYGKPLLGAGANLVAPASAVTPMNAHAAEGVKDFARYEGPTTGFIEQVYLLKPLAWPDHSTTVLLRNAAGDRGATIGWNTTELPYFTLWKNTAAEADGYVTGLEPGTGYPFNRKVERKNGRVPKLAPGESRRFALEFHALTDSEAVSKVAEKVSSISHGQKPTLETKPPVMVGD